jgi:hypothetical protein
MAAYTDSNAYIKLDAEEAHTILLSNETMKASPARSRRAVLGFIFAATLACGLMYTVLSCIHGSYAPANATLSLHHTLKARTYATAPESKPIKAVAVIMGDNSTIHGVVRFTQTGNRDSVTVEAVVGGLPVNASRGFHIQYAISVFLTSVDLMIC